jgi:predicted O-methyltransferase YrrM
MPLIRTINSGIEAADLYIADGYGKVKGMSSQIGASVCCGLMRIQSNFGITGHAVEIGAFEGRFLIALAQCLKAGEMALGIDRFDWPDPQVRTRFEQNCKKYGVAGKSIPWAMDSQTLHPRDLADRLGGSPVRFVHIDGDHSRPAFESDLKLAAAVLDPAGLIALDDMLHPGYPTLMASLQSYLTYNQDMVVLCVIDRESIFAATKFVLCRSGWFKRYENELLREFQDLIWPLGAQFDTHRCLVLSRDTRLAVI